MNSTVVPFPKAQQLRTPLAQFFRVGEFHLQFGEMQEALQAIPDLNRAGHFLSQTISRAERRAKDVSFLKPTEAQAKALKVDVDSLQKRTRDYASTMGKVADTLEKLHEERGSESARARTLDFNAVSQATKRDDQR